jgi:hypothetical protein
MARTLRDAEIAFILESLPAKRAVRLMDPPTSEFDYIVVLEPWSGAELAEAHYRLLAGVGRERAARVWFIRADQTSAPLAFERATPVGLDSNERELAARSIEARREELGAERRRQFQQVLGETIAWCSCTASAAQRLRTPEFRPWPIRDTEQGLRHFYRTTLDRMHGVAELAAQRAGLLREAGLLPSAPSTDLRGGRLLLWRPGPRREATPESPTGTATREVSGFFDAFDCPPWDTWVSWEAQVQGGEALVSWVPPDWLLRAEAACAGLGRPGVEWLREPFLGVTACAP